LLVAQMGFEYLRVARRGSMLLMALLSGPCSSWRCSLGRAAHGAALWAVQIMALPSWPFKALLVASLAAEPP
jgi:hypothetical protein